MQRADLQEKSWVGNISDCLAGIRDFKERLKERWEKACMGGLERSEAGVCGWKNDLGVYSK